MVDKVIAFAVDFALAHAPRRVAHTVSKVVGKFLDKLANKRRLPDTTGPNYNQQVHQARCHNFCSAKRFVCSRDKVSAQIFEREIKQKDVLDREEKSLRVQQWAR